MNIYNNNDKVKLSDISLKYPNVLYTEFIGNYKYTILIVR